VRGLCKKSDRVREIPTDGLDDREACENQQRNQQPALAGIARVVMRPVIMPVPMRRVRVMARVMARVMTRVIVRTVMFVRVRHEPGTGASGCILETL
jgi:hypothetical protein